ncbi:hypothetical protein BsWGS_27924 [Bradybaena similaris]
MLGIVTTSSIHLLSSSSSSCVFLSGAGDVSNILDIFSFLKLLQILLSGKVMNTSSWRGYANVFVSLYFEALKCWSSEASINSELSFVVDMVAGPICVEQVWKQITW